MTTKDRILSLEIVKNNLNFDYEQILDIYELFTLLQNNLTKKLDLSKFVDALNYFNRHGSKNHTTNLIFESLAGEVKNEIDFETFLKLICDKIVRKILIVFPFSPPFI